MNAVVPKELIVTITKFDTYSVSYNKELSDLMKKPHWTTNESYCYFAGTKYSNRWSLVPRGYGSDGASVPEILQGEVPVWGKHGPCVIHHDFLCEYGYIWEIDQAGTVKKVFLNRKEIDNLFFESLVVSGCDEDLIWKIKLGVNAHRLFNRPKVPNLSIEKQKFEMNLRAGKGWAELDGSRLLDYLGKPVSELVF